jgi:predicted nucleic acid-binding protein
MKSNLVILDANVIIEAFRGDFWNSLISRYKIHISSIVLHSEVYHYEDKEGQKIPIDLTTYIQSGRAIEISASVPEIASLENQVNPNFLERIDDGEKETLALLLTGRFDDFLYCTGDTRAIKALASLGLGASGISLEELLTQIGQKKKVPHSSYTKSAFDLKKAQGLQEQSLFLKKK